jgi:predicted Zn-dependent protease
VINSDQVRAYSTPGGFIILSDKLLSLCETEDQLAGVIAHEIAHISQRHGLAAIKSSNLTEAGQILSSVVMDNDLNYARQAFMLKQSFGASVDDIVVQLIDSGYSQSQETSADEEAVLILSYAGYNPMALRSFIEKTMGDEKPAASQDFSNDFFNPQGDIDLKNAFNQTHPGSDERMNKIRRQVKNENLEEVPESTQRKTRFNNNLVNNLR